MQLQVHPVSLSHRHLEWTATQWYKQLQGHCEAQPVGHTACESHSESDTMKTLSVESCTLTEEQHINTTLQLLSEHAHCGTSTVIDTLHSDNVIANTHCCQHRFAHCLQLLFKT
jgi:hypothetical protein